VAESLKIPLETVGFGRPMDAATINWTLLDPGASGPELSSLRGLDQQTGSHSGTAACGRKQMKPGEDGTAQIREGQDFLGGDQMPSATYFGKRKCA